MVLSGANIIRQYPPEKENESTLGIRFRARTNGTGRFFLDIIDVLLKLHRNIVEIIQLVLSEIQDKTTL